MKKIMTPLSIIIILLLTISISAVKCDNDSSKIDPFSLDKKSFLVGRICKRERIDSSFIRVHAIYVIELGERLVLHENKTILVYAPFGSLCISGIVGYNFIFGEFQIYFNSTFVNLTKSS